MRRSAALAALALLVALPAVGAPPARVELEFTVSTAGLTVGETRERLEHDGRRYRLVSTTRPRGIAALFLNEIHREAQGTVTPAGLRPERFEENGRRGGRRLAEFDWKAGRLTLAHGTATHTVRLPDGALDQASLAYSFAFRGEAPAEFAAHVTDGRGIKAYRYRRVAEETLDSALGPLRALRYEKVRDADDRRAFEFWLAPGRDWLPVKLRYVERNGDVFDSDIARITVP